MTLRVGLTNHLEALDHALRDPAVGISSCFNGTHNVKRPHPGWMGSPINSARFLRSGLYLMVIVAIYLVVKLQLVVVRRLPAASLIPLLSTTVYFLPRARFAFGLSIAVLVEAL